MSNKILIELKTRGLNLAKEKVRYLVEGTKGVIVLKVSFSEEWNGLSKYAVCYRANSEYSYAINSDGEALISDQAVISTSGEFKVKIIAANSANTITMVTNVVTLAINSSKFTGASGGNLEYPTNDYLASTLASVTAKASQVDTAIAGFNVDLATKQDVINDLSTIRAGAALGATALQSHQDISGKQDKLTAGANITITNNTISASGGVSDAYTKAETDTLLSAKANTSTTYSKDEVDGQFSTVNGDIETLYSDIANRLPKNLGASESGKYLSVAENGDVGATELALKTINNQSIIGSGNITVSSGEEDMTLLEDITIEETVKEVMIPLQANHSKKFKNISILVTIPKGNSFGNAFCLFSINDGNHYGRTGNFAQHATYSTILANCSSVKNGKIFSLSASAANVASNLGTFVFTPAGLGIYDLTGINSVKLISYSSIFVEGTVIKVWGV